MHSPQVERSRLNPIRRLSVLAVALQTAIARRDKSLRYPIASGLLFPAPNGGLLNLDNFRRREWIPAVEAAGIATPARIYDLRSTFASDALAAGVPVFQLARIMGTSVRMIERHYGALLDGSGAEIAGRLDALDAARAAGSTEQVEGG